MKCTSIGDVATTRQGHQSLRKMRAAVATRAGFSGKQPRRSRLQRRVESFGQFGLFDDPHHLRDDFGVLKNKDRRN